MPVWWWKGLGERKAWEDLLEGNPNRETFRANVLEIIEPKGFKKRIYFVAASGFLAGAYAIFSPNVVSPALAYIYWQDNTDSVNGLVINVVTLAGSCIGMVTFGLMADLFGRKRLYGLELIIGIVATLGLTQVSAGYNQQSMSAFAWIVWWRLVLGIAIGAEYPLSALIAAEWSATKTRGTMLAAVFLMQPIGQFLAYIVGYSALIGIVHDRAPDLPNWTQSEWAKSENVDRAKATIDSVWRCVIGVGAFPAFCAIALRLTIPETARYLVDVKEDLPAAAQAVREIFPKKKDTPSRTNSDKKSEGGVEGLMGKIGTNGITGSYSNGLKDDMLKKRNNTAVVPALNGVIEIRPYPKPPNPIHSTDSGLIVPTESQDAVSIRSVKREVEKEIGFWDDWHSPLLYGKGHGFRRILTALCICWFLMDVCFYGLGLDTPRTLAKIFAGSSADVDDSVAIHDWQAGFASEDGNIYDTMRGDSTRALFAIPVSAILGSLLFVGAVNYVSRVVVLRWTFVALAFLFIITGTSFLYVYETNYHGVSIALYAFALFILNIGPNTILFMLPAELFPTKYRGTCYGIAAASGKAGAILIQIIVHFLKITRPTSGKTGLAYMLLAFAPLMFIGAIISLWIPDVQHPWDPDMPVWLQGVKNFRQRQKMPPRSLEEITANPTEGQKFGLWEHTGWGRGLDISPKKKGKARTEATLPV